MAWYHWFGRRMGRDLSVVWRQAAEACGLRVMAAKKFPFYGLTARSQAVRVRITEVSSEELLGIHLTVTCTNPARANLLLSAENLLTHFEKRLGSRSEVEIGDPAFDQAFLLGGSPSRLLAVLDAGTRATLWTLRRQTRLRINGGTVAATCDETELETGFDRLLAQMIAVAVRLGADFEVPRELAANARRDPLAAVRLQNLLALIRDFPEHEVVAETVAAALADSVPEIRLRAAMAARDAGHPVLFALAEDAAIEDECAAAAIAALGRRLEPSRAQPILTRALRSRRLETAAACVEALGSGGAPEAIPILRRVLALERERLAVAAARALAKVGGKNGTPDAAAALSEALGRDLAEVRVAAAEGLGRIGSADVVPALREAAARHGDDRLLQRAVRQSIAEIHSRLPGATPGQLSLAAAAAGQLALATAGGELSLAGAEAGRLALAPPAPRGTPPGESDASTPGSPEAGPEHNGM